MNNKSNIWNDLHERPWATMWACRRHAFLGMILGVVLAVGLYVVLPQKWEARMIVGPAGRGAGADLSAFLPSTGAPTLQYLLQRVGSVTAADFSVYETLMTSPRVASALQKDEAFDGRLSDICDDCGKDSAALAKWLSHHLRIRPIGATQLRRITLASRDASVAMDLLRALHRLSDETIRTDMRIRTEQRITYLREQLALVRNPDHRDAVVSLLKEQERTRMMVGIDHDFAAEAIDPPSLSSKPISPCLTLLLPILMLMGMVLGVFYGLFQKSKDSDDQL